MERVVGVARTRVTRAAVVLLAGAVLALPALAAEGVAPATTHGHAAHEHARHAPSAPAAPSGHEQHAGHDAHAGHAMTLDRDGMVMHENPDRLPADCRALGPDVTVTVHVGTRYARTGRTFGYDAHQWQVQPCSRLHVTLINEDEVRHQWMVHGLPRYLYPHGMFHLEVHGGARKSGTFIVPSDAATYLVHCDLSHHMEQGLKAQLVVGSGRGTLPSIPGISGARMPDVYD